MTKFSDTQLKEQVESNEERGKMTKSFRAGHF